jgi:predicted DCC family thiol-disulfide oxidoreductase YuxK
MPMDDRRPADDHIEIWYDGACPICRGSRDWCLARDPGSRFVFRDFRAVSDDRLPISRRQAETSMWVRDPGGRLLDGFEGWRRILAELPRWRWLATVTGVPPLRWIGPPIYRLIARLRMRLPPRVDPGS